MTPLVTPHVTPRRCLRFIAALLVPVLLWAPERASGVTESGTISLNLERAQIADIVKQVGEATGRTILFDEQVRGVVSIVAKRPVELDEAWAILGSVLSMLGYSLLPSTEGNWRIASVAEAVGEAPFLERGIGSVETPHDRFVTTLIPLRLADLQSVLGVLQPLAGSRVTLVPFERTNSLIASGPERAIARLLAIADELDRVAERSLRFRVLRHRDVGDVEGWVEAFLEQSELAAQDFEAWSDVRTNSFVYRGAEEQIARFAEMLDRIDRPVEGQGTIRVLKVMHRDPEEISELIVSLSGSGSAVQASVAVDGGTDATTILEESDYSIAVDAATRSLVVRAAPEVHEAIREVVEILDQPPQLIAVDITVTQVLTPTNFTLGAAFNIPLLPGDDLDEVVGRLISNPGGAGLLAQPNAQTPLFGRVSRDAGLPFTIGDTGVEIPIEDTGVIDAGLFEARTEVLIEPSLVLTVGDRHEIFVGDNLPVPVSAGTGSGETSGISGVVLSQQVNIERRDVGTLIAIEARAGRVGKIQLDLDIELSQLAASLAGDIATVGPTFLERTLTVSARLDDGDVATVALDRERQQTVVHTGTPFLSKLPYIGWIFGREVQTEEDSRLAISVRARRIGSPAERVADSIRRRLAFERRNARDRGMPTAAGTGAPYAVLVTTRAREEDAVAISESLLRQGFASEVHHWSLEAERSLEAGGSRGELDRYDVYVTSLESMVDAADVAARLSEQGWEADLIFLPSRS